MPIQLDGYGVTPAGFVKKRFDIIIGELHDELSRQWNINTRLNPKSYLNVLLTNCADKFSELWEVAEQNYFAMYPSSAEDLSLDNAVEFGGIGREDSRPMIYPMSCECVDGTRIPKGARIKSNTNPEITFLCSNDTTVTRSAFLSSKVRVAALQANYVYTIGIDGDLYNYTSSPTPDNAEILAGLQAAIINEKATAKIDEAGLLEIKSTEVALPLNLTLSGNLTTQSVTATVPFASEENGEVILPNGTITEIVTAVTGLLSVNNLSGYILGRLTQNDVQLRQSYIDKIYARSLTMVESVKSAILLNVQGITAIEGYENDRDFTDEHGRYPHSLELVVDGGDSYQIAQQIFAKKAAGIQTYGAVSIDMIGNNGETIPIRFNRPFYVYCWFRVILTLKRGASLPPNYVDVIKDSIIGQTRELGIAQDLISQEFLQDIYNKLSGIAYIDIPVFYTYDIAEPPAEDNDYEHYVIPVSVRDRPITDETRIEVHIRE